MKPSLGASERWFPPKSKVNVQCVHVNSKIYFHKNNHLLTFSKPLLCTVVLDIWFKWLLQGRIQDFFRRGCTRLLSTSTPINHIVLFFFVQNTSCIRKPQVRGGAHPLHPPPRSAPAYTSPLFKLSFASDLHVMPGSSQAWFCHPSAICWTRLTEVGGQCYTHSQSYNHDCFKQQPSPFNPSSKDRQWS